MYCMAQTTAINERENVLEKRPIEIQRPLFSRRMLHADSANRVFVDRYRSEINFDQRRESGTRGLVASRGVTSISFTD